MPRQNNTPLLSLLFSLFAIVTATLSPQIAAASDPNEGVAYFYSSFPLNAEACEAEFGGCVFGGGFTFWAPSPGFWPKYYTLNCAHGISPFEGAASIDNPVCNPPPPPPPQVYYWYTTFELAGAACVAEWENCGPGGGFAYTAPTGPDGGWPRYDTPPCAAGTFVQPEGVIGPASPPPPCVAPMPNFQGEPFAVPVIVSPGETISIELSIINNGDADGATSAQLYWSEDDELDVSDVAVLGAPLNTPLLPALGGQHVFTSQNVTIPVDAADLGYLLWIPNVAEYTDYVETGLDESLLEQSVADNPAITNVLTAQIAKDKPNLADTSCDATVGNPIDVTTGGKKETETDYVGGGPFPLLFQRWYNSLLDEPWNHSYSSHLIFLGDFVGVVFDNGQGFNFKLENGVGVTDGDVPATLVATSGGYDYVDGSETTRSYDLSGRLVSVTVRNGFTHTLTYGVNGLASVSDDFGRTINFTTDTEGRVTSMTTPVGHQYSYLYDSANLLTTVVLPDETPGTQADNPTRTYLYESANLTTGLTGIVDENGVRYSTFDFDNQGRGILSEHAGGADSMTFVYAADSTTVTNALGKDTVYHYQGILGAKRLVEIEGLPTTSCEASSMTRAYDDLGYVSSKTDNNGNITHMSYTHTGIDPSDPSYRIGLEISRIEAAGSAAERTILTSWDAVHRLPAAIVREGKTSTFEYDNEGRLTKLVETDTSMQSFPYSTQGNTREWNYTYNVTGLLEVVDGPRTDVLDTSLFAYSLAGELNTITNALGHITEILDRDADGLPTRMKDANGVVTRLAYDARRRLITQTLESTAGDLITLIVYNDVNDVTKVTEPNGFELNYEYDDARRLTAIANSLGERVEYTLDASGNQIAESVKGVSGSVVRSHQRVFDELDRLRNDMGANGQDWAFGFDTNDNLVSAVDALDDKPEGWTNNYNNPYLHTYDALNRLSESEDPLGGESSYSYDQRGNLTSFTDQRGNATNYHYDGFDNLIAEVSPDRGTTIYTVDLAGNVTELVRANSIAEHSSYDALNRRVSVAYPQDSAENKTFAHDLGFFAKGNLSSVMDSSGTTTLAYDDRGNLLSDTRVIQGQSYSTSYSYDAAGSVISLIYPSGRVINYVRDSQARVTDILTAEFMGGLQENVVNNVAYIPFGPAGGWAYGNGLETTAVYDLDYRLVQLNVSDTNPILALQHSYDTANNLVEIYEGVKDFRLKHWFDPLYQQIWQDNQRPNFHGAYSYSLDEVGNKVSGMVIPSPHGGFFGFVSFSIDAGSNRLVGRSEAAGFGSTIETSYGYDSNGNRTSNTGGHGDFQYEYNERNRLESFSEDNIQVASYQHNAFEQRVSKTLVGGDTLHFHHDQSGKIIAESFADGTLIREYIYNGSLLISVVTIDQSSGDHVINFVHTDHIGTPLVVTNELQETVWRARYSQHGFASTEVELINLPIRYPGQYYDEESGLHHNYHRDYDPVIGSYIQSDPIGLVGGYNTYAYALNNPVANIDPFGLDSLVVDSVSGLVTHFDDAGEKIAEISFTSGVDGATDASVPWQGPIPPGDYSLIPNEISKGGWLRSLTGDWGDYRVPLQPKDVTKMFGRENFFLHGGSEPGSAGCVDIGSNDAFILGPKSRIANHDGPVTVTVK